MLPARGPLMESNRLTVLAAEVKDNLALSATAERSAIEAAIAAGTALCEAKDDVPAADREAAV